MLGDQRTESSAVWPNKQSDQHQSCSLQVPQIIFIMGSTPCVWNLVSRGPHMHRSKPGCTEQSCIKSGSPRECRTECRKQNGFSTSYRHKSNRHDSINPSWKNPGSVSTNHGNSCPVNLTNSRALNYSVQVRKRQHEPQAAPPRLQPAQYSRSFYGALSIA